MDEKGGDDAGEKKVTFNETTEEKNYTKERELDEEGNWGKKNSRLYERVDQHAINNQTNDDGVSKTTPKSDMDSQDALQKETRSHSQDKTGDKTIQNNDKDTKNDVSGTENKKDEEKHHTDGSGIDKRAENEDKGDRSKARTDSDESQFRFKAANENPVHEEKENSFETYFHDSNLDNTETRTNEPDKKTTTEVEKSDDIFNEKSKTTDYDFNSDEYYKNKVRKGHRNETDGEITIVTKKRNEPSSELDMMTDEEKFQLRKDESDESKQKEKANFSDVDSDNEERKPKHRCPSSSSSSVDSEPHIITKKKYSEREDSSKDTERGTDDEKVNAQQKSTRHSERSSKSRVVITPKTTHNADNKQANQKKTVQQKSMTPRHSQSPHILAAHGKQQNTRMSRSAGPGGRQTFSRSSSSVSSSRTPSRWSRPRTCGYRPEERRRKEREFFTAELERLKKSLKRDSSKIKKPKPKDYYPYVFTSLEPYYNTYTPQYLIGMPDTGYPEKQPPEVEMTLKEMKEHRDRHRGEEKELMFTTRCTAIGLTDPWDSLHMDKSVLPKLETSEMRRKRMEKMHEQPRTPRSAARKRPESKLGSTRLPKFPVISLNNQDLATKELVYTDIPMLRDELVRSFSHQEKGRKDEDYTRTRQDFYRMELDRITEMHKKSIPHMRAAYFAYLQNTPGSRKAVYECLRELNGKKESKQPQAVA